VTPAGDMATTPGVATALVALDGVTGGAFESLVEQPAAVRTATVPHISRRNGSDRTRPIYATLAAVIQRTRFWECCRP
jgi:hypothetical protein